MLKSIHLKNLALIEEAEIDCTKGLNIMTGETGAGKSIITGSVNIALGAKASKTMIRTGAQSALAQLLFTGADERALCLLDEMGIDRDGENILITRKITPDSSVSKINGENVTLSSLKKLTSLLVDVHGQHDHQSLLDPAGHMQILDDFGGEKIREIKSRLAAGLSSYRALRREFKEYDKDEAALKREISLLEYEADEIEKAALYAGEDEKLEESFKQMSRLQQTWENLNKINYAFSDEADGILFKTQSALKEIEDAVRIDGSLVPFKSALCDIDSLVKDFIHDLSRYLGENTFDKEKFDEISQRLNEINRLKAKYGDTVQDILSYHSSCIKRLEGFKDYEAGKAALTKKLNDSKAMINACARELSAARKEAAARLEPMIIENLKDLNFLSCEFKIDFEMAQKISADGFDRVQFMISLNPGEPLKPLCAVASGGELSRIMLAIKCALAENDRIETLIFDEIDTGISGSTAFKAAEKLKELSRTHQVICITHLPQIAAEADSHFLIEKKVAGESTISGVRQLGDEESVKELAKMISGSEVTQAALEHARELKSGA